MRIGIDAHFVGVRHGGNENHFEYLIGHLLGLPPDGDEYFAFSYRGAARARLPHRGLRVMPLRARSVYWQRAVEIPLYSRRLDLDVLHVPFNFLPVSRCRKVVSIHDLSFVHDPELYRPVERLRMGVLTRLAARWADHVLTVSEFSKRDIAERYGVPERRITVTPSAVDRAVFRPLRAEERRAAPIDVIDGDYLLFVGTLQPRKNIPTLLRAYAHLVARRTLPHRLVLVGRKGWYFAEVFRLAQELGLGDRLRWTDGVDTAGLVALYNGAAALVFPSRFEGFGVPILEAMSCGCPVVSSNAASMPEVYGDAALAFDPESVEELAAQLERVVDDTALRGDLVRRGFQNCERFSWARTAEVVHRVYHGA